MTERWTAEIEELVALVMLRVAYESEGDAGASIPDDWAAADPKDRDDTLAMVRPFLAALADAGVLVRPPGGKVREQWGVLHADGSPGAYIAAHTLAEAQRFLAVVSRHHPLEPPPKESVIKVRTVTTYPDGSERISAWVPVATEGAQTDG